MATQSSSVDGAANGVQPLDQLPLPVATVATPQPGVSSASLKAGEALALPLDAIHVVSRVFLGVGWRAESAAGDENVGAIDVDCLAAPYAQVCTLGLNNDGHFFFHFLVICYMLIDHVAVLAKAKLVFPSLFISYSFDLFL
jgi:hypothetical protein